MDFGEDGFGGLGPDEGFGVFVMLMDVTVDGGLEIDDRVEYAALQAAACERREEALDSVDPRTGFGREVEHPARMAGEPGPDLGVPVGAIVIDDGMDHLAGRDGALDRIEEADELLVAMALHAVAENGAVEHVQRRPKSARKQIPETRRKAILDGV